MNCRSERLDLQNMVSETVRSDEKERVRTVSSGRRQREIYGLLLRMESVCRVASF